MFWKQGLLTGQKATKGGGVREGAFDVTRAVWQFEAATAVPQPGTVSHGTCGSAPMSPRPHEYTAVGEAPPPPADSTSAHNSGVAFSAETAGY